MTELRSDLRTGWRIARVEVRRSARWYFQQPRAKIALALMALVFGSMVVFGVVPAAHVMGTTVRIEEQFPLLATFRQQMTVLVAGLIVVFALRTVERLAHIDGEEMMLTTTTPRAVVVGLLTAETIRLLLWLAPPTLLVVAAFAVGAQTPAMIVTVPVGLGPVLAFTAVAGYLFGIAALYVSRYVPLPSSVKTVLYPLGFVVVILGSQIVPRLALDGNLPFSLAPIQRALLQSPLAAYADVFLLGTPVARPLSVTALAVLGVFLAGVPIGFTVAGHLATRFWTTDTSVDAPSRDVPAESTPTTVPRPFAWSKSGRIGWHYLRYGLRSPQQFVHLIVFLFAFAPVASTLAEAPDLAYLFALGGSVIFGALLAGSAFCLNPFGDEQRTLPLLLLTETQPSRFVRGRIVAGTTASVPFVVAIPLAVVTIGPPSFVDGAAFVAVGLVLAVLSAGWAVGLGTLVPMYESRTMYGVETVVPSLPVLLGHGFAVGSLGIVSLVLTGIALSQGVPASVPVLGGAGLALPLLVGSACVAYVYAVRQYRAYGIER